MEESLAVKISSLPAGPGVYVMKDRRGSVLYVGKANNLRERVRAYFNRQDPRFFVPFLEKELGDVEVFVVKNEKEALLLENELIRRYRPRFNIRPREGRNFVYLRLDPRESYPRLEVTRKVLPDGARYFGPYPLARALRETLRVANRYFLLRTCSDHDAATHRGRPCVLCAISRFPAPSVFDIPEEEYRRHVKDALLFLQGKKPELLEVLRRRMEEAAAAMRFEEAARIRDQLAAIRRTLQPQGVVLDEPRDVDVVGVHQEGDRLAVYLLHVRQGRVIGGQAFPVTEQRFPVQQMLGAFLAQHYRKGHYIPDEVLLPEKIDGQKGLEELLAEERRGEVRVRVPRRGRERELVRVAQQNAERTFREAQGKGTDVVERLRCSLGLSRPPHRIEGFDVSQLLGETVVASRVAMTDGVLDKSRYRCYRIRTARPGDDYASLYEALTRRLRRGLEQGDLPDLIVVDGGKGQLAAALAALKDANVTGVDVVALAKEREVAPGGPGRRLPAGEAARRLPDRLYLPGRREALVLAPESPEMRLLVQLRDEAHRFAVTHHRRRLRQKRLRSALEDIPGVGQARRDALLRRFGSLDRLRAATVEELAQVEGVGEKTARRIYAALREAEEHETAGHPG